MASTARISEAQAAANIKGAQEWVDKHNRENTDTVAHFEPMLNGNVRLWVQKKGHEIVTLLQTDGERGGKP